MKKRHQQKLVGLSLLLSILWNIPFLAIFNLEGHLWGFPIIYAYVFIGWFFIVLFSYFILKKHYE